MSCSECGGVTCGCYVIDSSLLVEGAGTPSEPFKFEPDFSYASKSQQIDVYLADATPAFWQLPANAKLVEVMMIGGGGSGGSGRNGASGAQRFGGGGGGGAAMVRALLDPRTMGPVTIIGGGNGPDGAAPQTTDDTNGLAGTPGQEFVFTNGSYTPSFNVLFTLRAKGGGQGLGGGVAVDSAAGGAGGLGMFPGGAGGANQATANSGLPGSVGSAGAAGGGGGGGANATPTTNYSGDGGVTGWASNLPADPSLDRGPGKANSQRQSSAYLPGDGGAGGRGAFPLAVAGGRGNIGGLYGGGGGGGGYSRNDDPTVDNRAGDGADGVCVITTYF